MNALVKKLHAQELSRNQPILHFDVILQHDWPIKQCLLHVRVFFGGKTNRPRFDCFIHWLIKQRTKHLPKPFFKIIRKSLHRTRHHLSLMCITQKRLCLSSLVSCPGGSHGVGSNFGMAFFVLFAHFFYV